MSSQVSRTLVALVILTACVASRSAAAYVPSPVGGHSGEVDIGARATFERGKIEPNENEASFRKASWEVYTVGGGYTFRDPEDLKFLQDIRVGLDVSLFRSPAERIEIEPAKCLGRQIEGTTCELYAKDSGFLVTPTISANLIHTAQYSFGLYLRPNLPLGIDQSRFVLPRLDYVAGGMVLGVHLTEWLGMETNTYVGSGARVQNGAFAQTVLLALAAKRWILPWGAGIKLGSFVEGDLQRRFDAKYDAAYTADYPNRQDRIQSFRFGVALLPYFKVTENFAVELGYVQKLFGYDPPATQTYFVGVRAAFQSRLESRTGAPACTESPSS